MQKCVNKKVKIIFTTSGITTVFTWTGETGESKRVPKRRPFILFITFYEMKTKLLIK